MMPQANILTVDVEDWFHILEVEGGYTRDDWPGLESRVVRNTERLLAMFEETGARATFFVVGWIASRHPSLVRRIAAAGHEMGSHSFWHEVLQRHSRESLRADLHASKSLLEDLTGTPIRGFRAPGASIREDTAWAFDLLLELGFEYDASVCPGYSSHGGFESPFTAPHRVRCNAGVLDEIPSATVGLGRHRLSYAGGGYLRLLPLRLVRTAIAFENRRGWPTNLYVHPREIDSDQPRMGLPALRRFKYYVGLDTTEPKLRALLADGPYVSAGEWLAANRQRIQDRVLDVRAQIAASPPDPDPGRVPPDPPSIEQIAS